MKRKQWLARNPAVQEAVDQVHRNISDRWSRILDENVWLCRFYLERSSNMTPILRSHWKDLMRSIRAIIGALSFELPRVASEHHSAVSTYPGKWLDDVTREILREQLVWKDRHNIVDVWIRGVSDWRYQRRHILAFIYGVEDVDAGKALSALRRWVSKTIEAELLIGFRTGCPLVRAEVELENIWQLPTATSDGSTIAETGTSLYGCPSITLADLNDRNRHREVIWRLYNEEQLAEHVDGAIGAGRLHVTPEDILKQHPLLRGLTKKELDDLLVNKDYYPATEWAAIIVRNRTGKSIATIKRWGQPSGYPIRNLRGAA